MSVKICWKNANGAIDEINLKPGSTIYIGRYPFYPDDSPYVNKIYILDSNKAIIKDSGLKCDTVSRLHLQIKLDEQESILEIVDYGKDGQGSLNGFTLENIKYGPGSKIRIEVSNFKKPLKIKIGCLTFYITTNGGATCYEILKPAKIRENVGAMPCTNRLSYRQITLLRELQEGLLELVNLLEKEIVELDEYDRVRETLLSLLESELVNEMQNTCYEIYVKINMFKLDLRLVRDQNRLVRDARDLIEMLRAIFQRSEADYASYSS